LSVDLPARAGRGGEISESLRQFLDLSPPYVRSLSAKYSVTPRLIARRKIPCRPCSVVYPDGPVACRAFPFRATPPAPVLANALSPLSQPNLQTAFTLSLFSAYPKQGHTYASRDFPTKSGNFAAKSGEKYVCVRGAPNRVSGESDESGPGLHRRRVRRGKWNPLREEDTILAKVATVGLVAMVLGVSTSAATWTWTRSAAQGFGELYNYRGDVLACSRSLHNQQIGCHSSAFDVFFFVKRVSQCRMSVRIFYGKSYLRNRGLLSGIQRIPYFALRPYPRACQ
jgi:hypothetical protein